MGCFDSVIFKCPRCDSNIEVQSKAGDCALRDYPPDETPEVIAHDIDGDIARCDKCTSVFTVKRITKQVVITTRLVLE